MENIQQKPAEVGGQQTPAPAAAPVGRKVVARKASGNQAVTVRIRPEAIEAYQAYAYPNETLGQVMNRVAFELIVPRVAERAGK